MAELMTLPAEPKEKGGKEIARKIRREGYIPGVYYKSGEKSVALRFRERDIETLLVKKPPLFVVTWGEDKDSSRECVLRDVQYHPLSRRPIHIDVMGITHGVMVEASVKVKLTGTPEGVREGGGILQQSMLEVDLRCLPRNIPEFIEVDVSELEVGDSIHLEDIQVEGIEWMVPPERTVATVIPPKITLEAEETVEAEEMEEGAEGEETAGESSDTEAEAKDKE